MMEPFGTSIKLFVILWSKILSVISGKFEPKYRIYLGIGKKKLGEYLGKIWEINRENILTLQP